MTLTVNPARSPQLVAASANSDFQGIHRRDSRDSLASRAGWRAALKRCANIGLGLGILAGFLAVGTAQAATGAPAFQPDLAKGQAAAAVCLACHTSDGSRGLPANPILQGQHPEYLTKQLKEFKAGKRQNAIMMGFASLLSEDDMKHVSAYYASKKAPLGFAQNKETVALGESIWRGGIMSKGVPACAGCHSPNGAGIPALYPRIAGQHAEYTALQLANFASGARANNAQMTTIAGKMSEAEMKAVADYAAGLR